MAEQIYEFNVEMTCDGCAKAVEKVLSKNGINNMQIDVPNKKVTVTTSLPADLVLEYLKKTGKSSSYIGTK
ncbi:copper transport protein ATOX1 [Belonocnema kinseyi]|uniref:copper transport protein ATOX1 n=1 Tax=Belonocnema kinseyi TaxID=2817044 RepID=UPI00143DA25B|nr:copper transport protein ATOX1 [Belonocnema kinseyi]XP_033210413.1 copper transport protein ATOX1 [Belonocnema kinseyi]